MYSDLNVLGFVTGVKILCKFEENIFPNFCCILTFHQENDTVLDSSSYSDK